MFSRSQSCRRQYGIAQTCRPQIGVSARASEASVSHARLALYFLMLGDALRVYVLTFIPSSSLPPSGRLARGSLVVLIRLAADSGAARLVIVKHLPHVCV